MNRCKTDFLERAEDKKIAKVETFLSAIKREDPETTQDRLLYFLEGVKSSAEKSRDRDIALYRVVQNHFETQFLLTLIWCSGLSIYLFLKKRNAL
ncbi:MAG: hypothetical protein GY777_13560 [Candidatus Brocadiaceae bacterium]|nr:hypothetical protein [Candidatus Brocadiaceae bacterium]